MMMVIKCASISADGAKEGEKAEINSELDEMEKKSFLHKTYIITFQLEGGLSFYGRVFVRKI